MKIIDNSAVKGKESADAYTLISTKTNKLWFVEAGPRMTEQMALMFLLREFCASDVTKSSDPQFSGSKCKPSLAYWGDEFYEYDRRANCYRIVKRDELDAHIRRFLSFGNVPGKKGGHVPCPRSTSVVREVRNSLLAITGVKLDDSHPIPHWRRWRDGEDEVPDIPEDRIIAFRNGLLSVTKKGVPNFIKWNERIACDYFTTCALPYAFDPNVTKPTNWLTFLSSVWKNDQSSIDTLQEFMGLSLVPDTSFHKILLIVGPKRSGKGTIARAWSAMFGENNDYVATPMATTLTERFGLCGLLNSRLAIISDARFAHGRDSNVVCERLLSISGEDALTIDRKNRDPLVNHRLKTRLVIMSNEHPRLTDSAGALPSRFIALETTKSWYGNEDRGLDAKLAPEVPSIIGWALHGLHRLYERGRFLQPKAAQRVVDTLHRHTSEVIAFLGDCCAIQSEQQLLLHGGDPTEWMVEPKLLFQRYKEWCEFEENRKPRTKSDFISQVASCSDVRYERVWLTDNKGSETRPYRFVGVKIVAPGRVGIPDADFAWRGGAQ